METMTDQRLHSTLERLDADARGDCDEVFPRHAVHLSAFETGIGEGSKPDPGQSAGLAGGGRQIMQPQIMLQEP